MDHHFGNQLSFLSMSILVDLDAGVIILDQDAYVMKFLETVDENCGETLQQYPASADIIKCRWKCIIMLSIFSIEHGTRALVVRLRGNCTLV